MKIIKSNLRVILNVDRKIYFDSLNKNGKIATLMLCSLLKK